MYTLRTNFTRAAFSAYSRYMHSQHNLPRTAIRALSGMQFPGPPSRAVRSRKRPRSCSASKTVYTHSFHKNRRTHRRWKTRKLYTAAFCSLLHILGFPAGKPVRSEKRSSQSRWSQWQWTSFCRISAFFQYLRLHKLLWRDFFIQNTFRFFLMFVWNVFLR